MFIVPWFKDKLKRFTRYEEVALTDVSVIDFNDIDTTISDNIGTVSIYIDHDLDNTKIYLVQDITIKSPLIKRPTLSAKKEDIYVTIPHLTLLDTWISIMDDFADTNKAYTSTYHIHKYIREYNPFDIYVNLPAISDDKLNQKFNYYKENLQNHNKNLVFNYLKLKNKEKFKYEINTMRCMASLNHLEIPNIMISINYKYVNIQLNIPQTNYTTNPFKCSLNIGWLSSGKLFKHNDTSSFTDRITAWRTLVKKEFEKIGPLIPNIFIELYNTVQIICMLHNFNISKVIKINSSNSLADVCNLLENFDKHTITVHKDISNIILIEELFKAIQRRIQKKSHTKIFIGDKLNLQGDKFNCAWIAGKHLKNINYDFNKQLC